MYILVVCIFLVKPTGYICILHSTSTSIAFYMPDNIGQGQSAAWLQLLYDASWYMNRYISYPGSIREVAPCGTNINRGIDAAASSRGSCSSHERSRSAKNAGFNDSSCNRNVIMLKKKAIVLWRRLRFTSTRLRFQAQQAAAPHKKQYWMCSFECFFLEFLNTLQSKICVRIYRSVSSLQFYCTGGNLKNILFTWQKGPKKERHRWEHQYYITGI